MRTDDSPLLYDVLGSATAGILSRVVTHPLDTAKARLQAPGRPALRGPGHALLRTYRREGLRALYGGFGAVIIGGTPGTVVYLTSYAYFRDALSEAVRHRPGASSAGERDGAALSRGRQFAVYLASGLLAEAVACIIYVPVDVVKERMQVQQILDPISNPGASRRYEYKGSFHALREILRTEGARGIYTGYGATLASFGPFSALYFLFYEWSKDCLRGHSEEGETRDTTKLPLLQSVACSAGSGAVASWLTAPLDLAKLRLQVQRGTATAAAPHAHPRSQRPARSRGMGACLRAAYADGGCRGLFRGAGARVLHVAGAMAVTMTCYEEFRFFYAEALSVSA